MNQITILGLGPGTAGHLTREAWSMLKKIDEVWLRTRYHPVVGDLPKTLTVHTFDEIYEQEQTFEDVYKRIAETVLELGYKPEGVVYAVPGHPLVGESTVTHILNLAEKQNISVRIIEGLSFIEPTLSALSVDALDGLQILDALDIISLNHPPLNSDYPALIAQIYSRRIASSLKLVLMNQYPDHHPVIMVDGAGTANEKITPLPLFAIDREERSPLSSLFIRPIAKVSSFESFQQTVARLRSPEGCPWDREQTHETLRMNLLEESYEVLAAIDAGDTEELMEELGDLLLQVVLHTQVAIDDGDFQMPDVIAVIDEKLKRRHPHVWKGLAVNGVYDVVVNWEEIKRRERQENGKSEKSLLDGIPKALPALTQAYAYGDRVGRIGLQIKDVARLPMFLSICVENLKQAQLTSERALILGKLLFTLSVWAQHLDVDPESALRETNVRFAENFRKLEHNQKTGMLEEMTDEDIFRIWE